ncbi:MAG TPA: diaminopimelate epimerase [Candidatus Obscuribacterales bacterium]
MKSHKAPRLPAGLNSPVWRPSSDQAAYAQKGPDVLEFAKMQALGNDFVVVSQTDLERLHPVRCQEDLGKVAAALCNRHFGVGADGLVVVRQPDRPDCQLGWAYFNCDGSTAAMCGNGLRCLGLWAVERQLVDRQPFKVSTAHGPVEIDVRDRDSITVDLGQPVLDSSSIPIAGPPRKKVVQEQLTVEDSTFSFTCVSMGNPHCVIFNPAVDPHDYLHLAPLIQHLNLFPEGVNVEFALTDDPGHAKVFVWERGCGPTLACASGAAAVLVAGVLEGRLVRQATIGLPGGCLAVWWGEDGHVRLTGPAREIYRGAVDLAQVLAEAQRC